MSYPSQVDFREVVLEKLKVQSRAYLGPQVAHDARATVELDRMTDRLVMQLSTYVLSDRLLRDDQSASFSEDVVIEQPAPRWLVIPQAALTLAATALALAIGSIPVFLLACAMALAGVAVHAANPPRTHRRTVSATLTIPVTSYATFPENTTVYPDSLGRMVRYVQPETPRWHIKEDEA